MHDSTWVSVGVVAGVVLKKDGTYLLVQEGSPDIKGLWNCPAGHVDIGLTIEQTAVKEAREETGYDVELIGKVGVWHEGATHAIKHIFTAKIIGGEVRQPNEEIMDVKWFTIDEIRAMKDQLRKPWVMEAIEMVEQQS